MLLRCLIKQQGSEGDKNINNVLVRFSVHFVKVSVSDLIFGRIFHLYLMKSLLNFFCTLQQPRFLTSEKIVTTFLMKGEIWPIISFNMST